MCAAFHFQFWHCFQRWWLCRFARRTEIPNTASNSDNRRKPNNIIICMFFPFSTCIFSFVCLFRWRRRQKKILMTLASYFFYFFFFRVRKIIHVMMRRSVSVGQQQRHEAVKKTPKRNEPNRMNVIQFQRWVDVKNGSIRPSFISFPCEWCANDVNRHYMPTKHNNRRRIKIHIIEWIQFFFQLIFNKVSITVIHLGRPSLFFFFLHAIETFPRSTTSFRLRLWRIFIQFISLFSFCVPEK